MGLSPLKDRNMTQLNGPGVYYKDGWLVQFLLFWLALCLRKTTPGSEIIPPNHLTIRVRIEEVGRERANQNVSN